MKNPVKVLVVIASSAVLFGVMFPMAGGSITQLLGSQSTVGGCSTVGSNSSVGGQSTVGGQSNVCGVTTTTPFIKNLPPSGTYGGSFVAVVDTNGDGMKFVTAGTPGVCTVYADGLSVHFTGLGVCSLTAHVTAGLIFEQADGSPQTFVVGPAVPTTPKITNLPTGGTTGGRFTAVISTNGDGIKSVTTTTPHVCVLGADGLTVLYVHKGTCSLIAHVSASALYLRADGNPQSFTVQNARGHNH